MAGARFILFGLQAIMVCVDGLTVMVVPLEPSCFSHFVLVIQGGIRQKSLNVLNEIITKHVVMHK